MIQINLIPDIKREYLHARKMRDFAISISVIVSLLAILAVVIMALILGSQAIRESLADNAIKDEYASLSGVEDLNDMVTIQNQLSLISSQHQNKSMNSRLFSVLQAINPPAPNDVQFNSVTLDPEESTLVFEGIASAGYNAVETLSKTIENTTIEYMVSGSDTVETAEFASDVVVGETSYGLDSNNQRVLRFKMTVTYTDDLFTNRIQSVVVKAPDNSIDVTDSKLRVPSSLFSAPAADEGGN